MQIQNQTLSLADLYPSPANYNKHSPAQLAKLARSLTTFGQPRSIVAWRNPADDLLYILAGHGVTEAARGLGWETIRADVLTGYSEAEAHAYLVADNELARQSDPDQAALAQLLQEVALVDPALVTAAGFGPGELEALLRQVGAGGAGVDAGPQVDRAEELRVKWGVELGQLWACGEHRLICGDCTDPATVERVMGGERADMVFTDPPYGVEFQGKGGDSIEGDISYALIPLLFADLPGIIAEKCWIYICGGSSNYSLYARLFDRYFRNWPRVIVWDKGGMTMRHNGYHSNYEFIYYSFTKGAGDRWYSSRAGEPATDLWRVQKPNNERLHLTEKPVDLPERAIANTCPPQGIVWEPFAGSGSTIVACQNLGRRCRACEISPAYVGVCLERFHQMTGQQPALVEVS